MAEPTEHSATPPKLSEGDEPESANEPEVVKFSPEEEAVSSILDSHWQLFYYI